MDLFQKFDFPATNMVKRFGVSDIDDDGQEELVVEYFGTLPNYYYQFNSSGLAMVTGEKLTNVYNNPMAAFESEIGTHKVPSYLSIWVRQMLLIGNLSSGLAAAKAVFELNNYHDNTAETFEAYRLLGDALTLNGKAVEARKYYSLAADVMYPDDSLVYRQKNVIFPRRILNAVEDKKVERQRVVASLPVDAWMSVGNIPRALAQMENALEIKNSVHSEMKKIPTSTVVASMHPEDILRARYDRIRAGLSQEVR